jgi:hypothetical protein
VSRYLLAQAVRADGFDVLITGDGADEVFGGTTGGDYLPIVGALTRAAGLAAWAPFLDPAVVATVARDPGKRALRALAQELGVPAEVASRAKRPRFAPAMDLARHWDAVRVRSSGGARACAVAGDGSRYAWAGRRWRCLLRITRGSSDVRHSGHRSVRRRGAGAGRARARHAGGSCATAGRTVRVSF